MRLRPKVKVIGKTEGANLLGSWVGIAYKQLERMRRQYDIGVMKLPHFKWLFFLEEAHITIVAKRVGRDEITIRPLSLCPEELLSGLSDPQQPTMIDVVQPDESVRQEFSRYWPAETPHESRTSHKLSAEGLVNNYAGLYSGRMKALVQDQLGRGGNVGWDFRFSRTHGIYTASDDSIWAIQISAAGVFAAHLPLCPFDPEDTVGGFSARARKFPTSRAIQIAPASAVAEAYTKSPLWSESGWAFSESGSKACNVVHDDGFPYMLAYLYEITITEKEHTIGNKPVMGPGSASMQAIDQDYFWGNRVTHIKVPRYPTVDLPQSLVSIDWFRDQIAAPSDNIDTPVHAYYDGETMVVSRYIRAIDEDYTHTDGSTGSAGQHGFKTTVFPDVPVGFETGGPFSDLTSTPDPTTLYALDNEANFPQKTVLAGAFIDQTRTGTWSERANSTTDVLTIPFGDRESVYHVRRTRDVSFGTNVTAAAEYRFTKTHYKPGLIDIFHAPYGCMDGPPFNHPNFRMSGDVAVGDIVYDEEQPPPDPFPSGYNGSPARFGTAVVTNNPLIYFVGVGTLCENIVTGGSPDSCAQAQFDKMVELGSMNPNNYEYAGVRDDTISLPQPGNERFAARYTGLRRDISGGPQDGQIFVFGSLIRAMPVIFVHRTSTADKRASYTHGAQSINESSEEFEFGVALGNDPINLTVDEALWDELVIYDEEAENTQRLLIVAQDASVAARRLYSEEVFPTMGAPIGTLLAGTDVYPLNSVTAPMASWIGKP